MQVSLLKNIHQQPSWWLAGIILLASGIYMPVINYGWITGADQFLFVDNPLFHHLTVGNLVKLFLSPVFGNYQPLALASLFPGMAGPDEMPLRTIHLLNLFLHLLNVILLFRLAQMLTGSVLTAAIAALLFAVHPLNAEAVAWISARGQLLGSFFFLAGAITYLYRLRHRKKYHFWLITLFFFLALLSNPVAIVFPPALLLIDYLDRRDLRTALSEKRLWLLMSFVFVMISVYALSVMDADIMPEERGFPQNMLMGLYALAMLLLKFIVPTGLSAFHPLPGVFSPAVIIIMLLPFVLWLPVLLFFRRQRALISSLLFFFLAGTASLIFTFYGPGSFRESQAYLPYMGLFILVSAGVKAVLNRRVLHPVTTHVAITTAVFAMIIFLGWMSFQRHGIWHNSERLWTSVIERYPDHHHAFFMRGDYHAANGNFVRARFDYARCIERKPDAYMAVNNIGLIYMEEGDLRLAIAEFSKAIEINGSYYKSYLNRGVALMRLGKNDPALVDINMAAALKPAEPLVYFNRALVYQRKNSLSDAISDFGKAIELDPGKVLYYKERGKAYVWMRMFGRAEQDFTRAISLNPADAEMWFRRSLARVSQEKFDSGLQDALMARKLGFAVEEEYIKGLTLQVLKDELPSPE